MRIGQEDQQSEMAGGERVHFLQLATDVSRLLLGAHADSVDARVNEALARIGEFYAVAGITLRWFDEEQTALERTHEWRRTAEPLPARVLNLAEVPYLGERILRREVVAVRQVDELPDDARAEAEILRSLGTRSVLAIPLVVDEMLVGASIHSTEREERDWSDPMVAKLRLLGEMIASAIARCRAESALQQTEEKFRALFERGFFCIWTNDLEGRFLDANDATLRLLGYTGDEFRSLSFTSLLDEDQLVEAHRRVGQIKKSGALKRPLPLKLKTKAGEFVWVEAAGNLISRDGRPSAIQGIARDITERKLAEEALSRRMDYQSLLSEVSAGLLRASAAGMDAQIELALARICGIHSLRDVNLWWFDEARECATRSHAWKGVGPGQFRMSDAPWFGSRVLEGQITKVWRLADLPPEAASDRDLLASLGIASILFLPLRVDRALVGFALFSRNLEGEWPDEIVEQLQLLAEVLAGSFARSRAMKSLQQRERDLVWAQRVGHVGSYVADPASGRVEFSDELCTITGCVPGQVSNDLGMSFIHPEDSERVRATRQRARTGAVPPEAEYRVLRGDGSIRHVYDRWEIERDPEGEPAKVLGTVQDITAHKKAEASLRGALAEVTRLKEQIEAENVYLREEARITHRFGNLIGESPEFTDCLRLVEQVAPTDSTVLILGETGTGKELIARALHELSPRRQGPLVSVNCAALPEGLIESELFGHEKGAFTGALAQRRGRFELASGGTLFLDEIGDLPLHLQAKLLRVLQEGEIERVGGSEVIPVDARVIGSTHRDLARAVERGDFRDDLYYRISGFPIHVPPLRERVGDIVLLANHFVHKHSLRLGRGVDSISSRTLHHLTAYSWPGNVRELEHAIERALIGSTGPVLDVAEPLKAILAGESPGAPATNAAWLDEVERGHIERVLEKTQWVIEGKKGAAGVLNIAPSTLRSRMKKLGIARPA